MCQLTLVDNDIKDLNFEVDENETLKLDFAMFSDFKSAIINVNVKKGGTFQGAFADFSRGSGRFEINVNLNEGSTCFWHLASLNKKDYRKVFSTSCFHLGKSSSSLMSNYGICQDKSSLTFTGTSSIEKYATKAKTRQEAKIIVFDENADGKCSPVLKIDENDVDASHGATVGKLNDSHLFYLMSRGLSENEAKRLITLGYLKPIVSYFSSKEVASKIIELIEEGI
ncbi:MAG TPA: hypothetical protein DEF61_03990 [Firmicutes bacterium]|nr:hypothetical protein [Bacillota bacterium]HBX25404.1 hypothetical protein [Bacillota bacterium]